MSSSFPHSIKFLQLFQPPLSLLSPLRKRKHWLFFVFSLFPLAPFDLLNHFFSPTSTRSRYRSEMGYLGQQLSTKARANCKKGKLFLHRLSTSLFSLSIADPISPYSDYLYTAKGSQKARQASATGSVGWRNVSSCSLWFPSLKLPADETCFLRIVLFREEQWAQG